MLAVQASATAATRLLDELTDGPGDPLCVLAPDGSVKFANQPTLEALGYSEAAALLGRDGHTALHRKRPDGSVCEDPDCPLQRALRGDEVAPVERDWFVRGDGSMVPVSYAAAPLVTEQGVGATVSFRDIRT